MYSGASLVSVFRMMMSVCWCVGFSGLGGGLNIFVIFLVCGYLMGIVGGMVVGMLVVRMML